MNATDATTLPIDMIEAIFQEIPLIREVLELASEELDYFLKSSKILQAEPGEVIIRRGEFDNWVYFLLLGQLLVYPEFQDKKRHVVSYISPGEMFGELAYIRELDRNATIVADTNSREVLILAVNFTDFGAADDFSKVTIYTKTAFYRTAVRTIRKRLEMLKIDFPNNELALKTPKYKEFVGEKNTLRELLYLQDQSKVYAKYLHKWNRSLEIDANYSSAIGTIPVDNILNLLK